MRFMSVIFCLRNRKLVLRLTGRYDDSYGEPLSAGLAAETDHAMYSFRAVAGTLLRLGKQSLEAGTKLVPVGELPFKARSGRAILFVS